MKLWNYLKNKLLSHPDKTVCEENTSLRYEELAIWAEAYAAKLGGIKCCAILCSSEMISAMALLACFAAEVTAVPLSVRYGKAHCNKILDTISPEAIITDINGEIEIYSLKDSEYSEPEEHPALIMCTSGTTGIPKGAMLSESNIIANVSDISRYFAMDENDTILIARPLYHCAVLSGEFLTAIAKGANIRFYSGSFNPSKILELIKKHKISVFCATPTLISAMARFNRNGAAKTLKHICISGECMNYDVGLKIREAFPECEIYHIYGLTEACPRVSYLPPEYFDKHPDCVGIPLRSVYIKILNDKGTLCKKNEEGLLYVKGDNVMIGYYNAPEKTKEVLNGGWLCTGDIALINDVGFLKIKGRKDDMIIKSGMNIYPTEIEGALKRDDRVKEVLVYGYRAPLGTEIGMKLVGHFRSVGEVRSLCMELLPSFQVPSKIELVSELLRNGSGKIIRRAEK